MSDGDDKGAENTGEGGADPKNTAQVDSADKASGDGSINEHGSVNVERHEAQPVHLAIVMDMTDSAESRIANAKIDFATQMRALKENIEAVSSIGSLQLSLVTHQGNVASYQGTYDDPEKLAELFQTLECQEGFTQICGSLEHLRDIQERSIIEDVDAVLVIGDTANSGAGSGLDDYNKLAEVLAINPDFICDTHSNLRAAGESFGAPIITMLDETEATKHVRDNNGFKELSAASGVQGCPLDYDAEITFSDYVAATAAMTAGPEAVEEMADKVNPRLWMQIPQETIRSVYAPEKIIMSETTIIKSDNVWATVGKVSIGAIIGALLMHLHSCEGEPPETPTPEPVVIEVPVVDQTKICGPAATFNHIQRQVHFSAGSYELTQSAQYILDMTICAVKNVMNDDGKIDGGGTLVINGGASTDGSAEANMDLSWQRGQEIMRYMRQDPELINVDILIKGHGENRPVHMPDGPESIAELNRYGEWEIRY